MATGETDQRARWITQLTAVSGAAGSPIPTDAPVTDRVAYIEDFRDEYANRRASDRAFLAHLLEAPVSPVRPPEQMALDERLWWGVCDGRPVEPGLIGATKGLLPDPDALAIEYRTMVELGALQALWWHALRGGDHGLRSRALDAARWHVEELQPDNAINRPWGLSVFVELAIAEPDETTALTAELHAQTLLHNACVSFGKPDLLSALILEDARRQLVYADQPGVF